MASIDKGTPERDRQLEDLQKQVDELTKIVKCLDDTNTIQNVLAHGFETMACHLEPLKDLAGLAALAPRREPLEATDSAALGGIHVALARPDFRNPQAQWPPTPEQQRTRAS